MSQNLQLDSVAYLKRLVRCNQVIGDCLGFSICEAKDYEKASKCLKDQVWPLDAAVKAEAYKNEFPWLPGLFNPRRPDERAPRVPIWEQAANDFVVHPRLQNWLVGLANRFRKHCPPRLSSHCLSKNPDAISGNQDRLNLSTVLWRAFRIMVGKAAHWEKEWAKKPDKNWVDLVLEFARSEPGNEIREMQTGVRRKPDKPKSDKEPERQKLRILPNTDAFPPRSDDLEPPDSATRTDEPPEAIAEDNEKRRLLLQALGTLPEKHQRVIHLQFFEDLSLADTARQMNMTEYRVRQHYDDAMFSLNKQLGRALYGSER